MVEFAHDAYGKPEEKHKLLFEKAFPTMPDQGAVGG